MHIQNSSSIASFVWHLSQLGPKLNKKVKFDLEIQKDVLSLYSQTMCCMGKLELVIESKNVSIYSPKYDGETQTEFEKFMYENGSLPDPQLKKDFDAIISVIKKMVDDCGARENLFRLEGKNIKAIPLCVEQRRRRGVGTLRLYCIRISDKILVIGNGGIKKVRKYEDDPVLLDIVDKLRSIEHQIYIETHRAQSDYDDYQRVKSIIETVNI